MRHKIQAVGLPVRRRSGHCCVTCGECGWRTQLGHDLPGELRQARLATHRPGWLSHEGPHADNLRHMLIAVEVHYLAGYGDGATKALEAEPIDVLPGTEAAATAVLEERPETRERVRRVIALSEGFESMYGMELLATVHWVATHDDAARTSPEIGARLVQEWSARKKGMFTERHVRIAWLALRDKGWIAA